MAKAGQPWLRLSTHKSPCRRNLQEHPLSRLQALGVAVQLSPESVATCVEQTGLGFMFAPYFHPAMKAVRQVRSALQVRTLPLPFWEMLAKTLQLLLVSITSSSLDPILDYIPACSPGRMCRQGAARAESAPFWLGTLQATALSRHLSLHSTAILNQSTNFLCRCAPL